jgi:hypothetical protein
VTRALQADAEAREVVLKCTAELPERAFRNYQKARIVAGGTRDASTEWRYVPVGGAEPPPVEVRSDWVAIFPSGEKEVKLASRPCAGAQ